MRGRSPRLPGLVSAQLFPVAEAVLVGVMVVTFAALEDGDSGAVPDWVFMLAAVLLALVVLGHRGPVLWRNVAGGRTDRSASGSVRVLWGGIEVAAAIAFLGLVAFVTVGLLGSVFAMSGESYALGVELFTNSFLAAILSAMALLALLVTVTARLVATALVRLGRKAVAAAS